MTKKELNNSLRAHFMNAVRETLEKDGEQLLLTNSNEFSIPTVDLEGNETWMVITFKVPTGSRDGEGYDGFTTAQVYAEKVAENERKAKEQAEKKAKKIAADKAKRELAKKEKGE